MEIKREGKDLVIKAEGEIDHHVSKELKEKIEREYKRMGKGNIIFDMSGVRFMDSSAIGMIIGRYKEARASGGKVYIENMNEEVERLIEISGLRKIVEVR